MIDKLIKFLNDKFKTNEIENRKTSIEVFYQNQMHINYKLDERVVKDIVLNHTSCIEPNTNMKIIFYYKNIRSSNLVMQNNLCPPPQPIHQTNLVYKFVCPFQHCKAEYIGYTECTLSRRMANHCQNGSILKHFNNTHDIKPDKQQLIDNSSIIAKGTNKYNLLIKEALLIQANHPSINRQYDTFPNILKLQVHRGSHRGNSAIDNVTLSPSASTNQPPVLTHSPHTPVRTLLHVSDMPPTTQTHTISPDISNRINALLSHSRSNANNGSNTPQVSRLRSGRILRP